MNLGTASCAVLTVLVSLAGVPVWGQTNAGKESQKMKGTLPSPPARHEPSSTAPSRPMTAEEGLARIDFLLGKWDVEARSADGKRIVGRARTDVRMILDGTAMQDDYYGLDPAGDVVFRGTSMRTYVPSTGNYVVHWAMAGTPGYTYIDVEYRDGELRGKGRGFDDGGEFIERYRYFDLSPTHYSFEMSRSYDGGANWQLMANLRATKR